MGAVQAVYSSVRSNNTTLGFTVAVRHWRYWKCYSGPFVNNERISDSRKLPLEVSRGGVAAHDVSPPPIIKPTKWAAGGALTDTTAKGVCSLPDNLKEFIDSQSDNKLEKTPQKGT